MHYLNITRHTTYMHLINYTDVIKTVNKENMT